MTRFISRISHALVGSIVLVMAVPVIAAKPESDDAEKWQPLFDGKTVEGWTPRGEVEQFEVVDGEIHLLASKNVWVTTDAAHDDFILEAEAKIPDGATAGFNSGIAFRCTGAKGKPKGYQCEIDGGNPGKSGGVFGIGLGGWLYPKTADMEEYRSRASKAIKHRQWNHYRVECVGPKIRTFVNGQLVAELEDDQSLGGYFGIQHHGKGGVMRFRNIRVQPVETSR